MTIEVKRLYLPITRQICCPKCQSIIIDDFEKHYLSYPSLSEPESRYLICDNCETEVVYKFHLSVNVVVIPSSIHPAH